MIEITIYIKKDAPLCEIAKQIVLQYSADFEMRIEVIDIARDRDLYLKFKDKVPVIFVNGRERITHKVNRGELEDILEQCGERKNGNSISYFLY